MKKIILRIDDKMSDEKALVMALKVVQMGKISESAGKPQYCFHTRFLTEGRSVRLSVQKLPSGTETFYIR